eukprot:scaffold9979_cov97-Skeletonema_marinoi.AAC.3
MPHQVTLDVVATLIQPNNARAVKKIVRYDMVLESMLATVSDASSGHLLRCSDVDTTKQYLSREKDVSILSWPTKMGH